MIIDKKNMMYEPLWVFTKFFYPDFEILACQNHFEMLPKIRDNRFSDYTDFENLKKK